jgi:predicted transcriptional regulator of viral defense system
LLSSGMRDSTTPRDVRLARLAAARHGVVSVAQLHELGFDRDAIARRVQAGRLHRLHRGVYAVGHTVLKREGRWLAAVLACGPGAALSHRSAAALWGIRATAAARIDVAVPHTSGCRSTARIVVHRSRRAVDTTVREAIPVTTPMQTLVDLATALPRRRLEKACEDAEALQLFDLNRLDARHPGAKRLLEIVETHDLGTMTRSELEDAFLELCDRHDIPRPLVNSRVEGFEVDFCWRAERLIVETDGRRHATLAAFERDRARDAMLIALGWRVMRITKRQLRRNPDQVAALVLSARSPLLATPGSRSP